MSAPTGKRRSTLAMVAKEAGVSAPTVSKVLNGHGNIAPETRARIEALLAEHDYVPRAAGRRRTQLQSLTLVFDTFENPYGMEITRGVLSAAAESGVTVNLDLTSLSGSRGDWLDRVLGGAPNALVLVTTALTSAQRKRLAKQAVPFVVIDPLNLPGPDVISVGATNWTGALAAVEHLIGLGHRRIGAIVGRPETSFGGARLHGYRSAHENAGLAVDPTLVAHGDFRFEPALRHALRLLRLDEPPTAIFASSDVQALGVLEAARQLKMRVPDGLSVVSFDDTLLAKVTAPPLTAIRQPFAEMGRAATQILQRMIAGEQPESHRIELATHLVVRESTAVPRTRSSRPRRD